MKNEENEYKIGRAYALFSYIMSCIKYAVIGAIIGFIVKRTVVGTLAFAALGVAVKMIFIRIFWAFINLFVDKGK